VKCKEEIILETQKPVSIGDRIEMLVDGHLIADAENAQLRMYRPRRGETALAMERPWEGPGSGVYSTVFRDGGKFRMYYRATSPDNEGGDRGASQFCCCAESADGMHWERPDLGLFAFRGSKANNIVMAGVEAHNFSPWLDENPACPAGEKFKAVCGLSPHGLMAYKSADGYTWEKLQEEPVITEGEFDSHNLWFWDVNTRCYRCYSRYWEGRWSGIRAVQSCTSADFRHWSTHTHNQYGDVPLEHFYTNATALCPGAPHHYLSFPMRFVGNRKKWEDYPDTGVSDSIFMSSRDGVHFDRGFTEPWIAPDLDPRNWTQRNYITACGILETSPAEFSLYVNEHYQWDDAFIRRYTVRRHGFGSIYGDWRGGRFTTRPLIFDGDALYLNYATSSVGLVRVGILGPEGFGVAECDEIYGNELDKKVSWGGNSNLSQLRGRPVRLVIELKDADLFAIRFG